MEKYLKKLTPSCSNSSIEVEVTATDPTVTATDVDVTIPAILEGTYFEIISQENGKVKAACLMCKSNGKDTVISGSFKATTNFKLHMKRLHNSMVTEFDNYKIETKRKGLRQKRTAESGKTTVTLKQMKLTETSMTKATKQNKFEQNVIHYIVNSMKPLSTIEDENFKKIFIDIDSDLKLLSRRTLGRKIDYLYNSTVTQLKEALLSVKYVSTTADIWSTKHRSFIGVTAHWITENNKSINRSSCILDCQRFKGTHSYDRIAEILSVIFSNYELKHEQIVSTITDNGSNFVKAFHEFGVPLQITELDDEDDEEFELDKDNDDNEHSSDDDCEFIEISETPTSPINLILPNHLRCASHTLNLLATTDFNNIIKGSTASRLHHPAFGKCTSLWNLSRRPKTSEIISDTLGCSLIYPCPTRWNSLYDSTAQLLKYKSQLNSLNSKLNLSSFKDIELEYLTEFCLVMKPIATALDLFQKEIDCYYGQLLPTLFSLRQRLQNLQDQNLRYTSIIVRELLAALEKRFAKQFQLGPEVNEAILASCFHPAFKLNWLPENLVSEIENKRIRNICINAMEGASAAATVQGQNGTSSSSDTEEDFFILRSPERQQRKSCAHAELEFVTFLNDKSKSLSCLFNYPIVKSLFIRFNTSLCSSAPIERLFSFAGFIHSPARGRLSDKMFKTLLFLKGNSNFINLNKN